MFSISYLPSFFKTIFTIQILLAASLVLSLSARVWRWERSDRDVSYEEGFIGKGWLPVWMFYGCIINCHSLGFKSYPLMITVSVGQESGHSMAGSSPESLRRL